MYIINHSQENRDKNFQGKRRALGRTNRCSTIQAPKPLNIDAWNNFLGAFSELFNS